MWLCARWLIQLYLPFRAYNHSSSSFRNPCSKAPGNWNFLSTPPKTTTIRPPSLTACQIEIPGVGTVKINDGSNAGSHAGGNTGDDTIHTGNDNDDSLALLRKTMAEVPDYIFAAAYIGSAAGSNVYGS